MYRLLAIATVSGPPFICNVDSIAPISTVLCAKRNCQTLSADAKTLVVPLWRSDMKGPSRLPLHGKKELCLLENYGGDQSKETAGSNPKKHTHPYCCSYSRALCEQRGSLGGAWRSSVTCWDACGDERSLVFGMVEQSKLLGCSGRREHPRHERTYLQLEPKVSMIFGLNVGERKTREEYV